MSNRIEETERFRPLARHYMKALGEIAIEKDLDAAQMMEKAAALIIAEIERLDRSTTDGSAL
jgi:hypothetical protein